jgi:uncharacterized alpha-E superfamily protein
MLSRTANDLFWMSRHMERAENVARMLDVTHRMTLLPYQPLKPGQSWAEPWAAPLIINGLVTEYYERSAEVTKDDVLGFMLLDPANPSSIHSCLKQARENGRAQRGAISSEMWECLNATWLKIRGMTYDSIMSFGIGGFFDWVKIRSQLFRGITFGTMLRDEGYRFIRLSTFLERADNTARILDVKYHTLLPSVEDIGGAVDYYQWGALLRSVGSFEAYRKIYRDAITPRRIAEMLILRDDVPRSLHACLNAIYEILRELCDSNSLEPERLAGEIHAQLHYGRTEKIVTVGLHEYLMQFLEQIAALNKEINSHFLAPVYQ